MKKLLLILSLSLLSPSVSFADRIKDLVDVAGVRTNQLIGFGLVAGLSGTGDGNTFRVTGQSLSSLLSGLGVSVDGPVSEFDLGDNLINLATQFAQQPWQTDNLAAVLVTAARLSVCQGGSAYRCEHFNCRHCRKPARR